VQRETLFGFVKIPLIPTEDPDSFFTRITDVDRVAQATILQGIAEHYVREAEWGKVAAMIRQTLNG
jgi:hypothetical protein